MKPPVFSPSKALLKQQKRGKKVFGRIKKLGEDKWTREIAITDAAMDWLVAYLVDVKIDDIDVNQGEPLLMFGITVRTNLIRDLELKVSELRYSLPNEIHQKVKDAMQGAMDASR